MGLLVTGAVLKGWEGGIVNGVAEVGTKDGADGLGWNMEVV
jgi:hypothetical protein